MHQCVRYSQLKFQNDPTVQTSIIAFEVGRAQCCLLFNSFLFFILNAPLTSIFSTISPHYICCFLPTLLVLDFFYLNKWLISTFHHVTYHFFISHSHSTSLPFLSLFLSLSSSSSPFSYKYSLILLFKTHPKGEGQTFFPFSSLLTYISSHLFHSLVFRVFMTSRRRGAVYTITTSHQPSSPPSSSPWESRP